MNIVVTGSLGNISKPLTQRLVQNGHTVTVVSSKPEKQKDIEALGARAAIGTLEDVDFITATFVGADAAYCMVPPNHSQLADRVGYIRRIGENYAEAVRRTGLGRVVLLSTYGGDLDRGTGILVGAYHVEQVFSGLPGLNLTIMRPTYFYYNLYIFMNKIRNEGVIPANYGADKVAMVAPADIAEAVAEELALSAAGRKVRYVASDDPTGNDIARALGAAIGKPDLKWEIISDDRMIAFYKSMGLPGNMAEGLTEMFVSLRTGRLDADYRRHEPPVKGRVKIADFAREFAAVYAKTQ